MQGAYSNAGDLLFTSDNTPKITPPPLQNTHPFQFLATQPGHKNGPPLRPDASGVPQTAPPPKYYGHASDPRGMLHCHLEGAEALLQPTPIQFSKSEFLRQAADEARPNGQQDVQAAGVAALKPLFASHEQSLEAVEKNMQAFMLGLQCSQTIDRKLLQEFMASTGTASQNKYLASKLKQALEGVR